MPAPENTFKKRLTSGETQIGLWVGLGDPSVAELAAGCGFDWLVIDADPEIVFGPNAAAKWRRAIETGDDFI